MVNTGFHRKLSRRQVVMGGAGLGLLAGCGRLPWQGPGPARTPRVGVLVPTGDNRAIDAFQQGLREQGYGNGQNLVLKVRRADGHEERLPDLAAELVRLAVDVIVTIGEPAIRAASEATETIPIIMASSRDPVGSRLVESLARPGGNITGLSQMTQQLAGKRLELLTQAVSPIAPVAVLGPATSAFEFRGVEEAAQLLGVQLRFLEVLGADEFEGAFANAREERVGAVLVLVSPLTVANFPLIAGLAVARQLPTIFDRLEFVQAGGLMGYGPNQSDLWRRSAVYVDKILRGAKPADLPVELPMRFDFVVNTKTAQALGLTFPPEILLQVTEVIQ
jgi:putative tryptophan/tyrosine transport system substrate-binding protein